MKGRGLAFMAGVLALSLLAGCRQHSWEKSQGEVPPGLKSLGAALDASGVSDKPPRAPADESVALFFRKNHHGVAVDYIKHFEGKGFQRLACQGRASSDTRIHECFKDGTRSVHVKVRRREFPLFGTAFKRSMAEVEVYLNPPFLTGD